MLLAKKLKLQVTKQVDYSVTFNWLTDTFRLSYISTFISSEN